MTDVYCAKCGEPWDTAHLRDDAIWEAIDQNLLNTASFNNWDGTLRDTKIAEAFSKLGWVFARSIYAILQCPDCKPDNVLPDADERIGMVSILAELMEGDDDALICMLQDVLVG
jgi:hypothetical protein